ncbi:MAG: hypothetical protein NC453_24020 [Muribaculum sp.]|nr:hypothetical protein [Muribaculum sp.]
MKGLTRVIAVGNKAGKIVDNLRQDKDYDNVDFWFCGTKSSNILSHGYLSEPHILFSEKFNTKYIDAIHVDNEMAAIVIAGLDEEISCNYLYDIVGEAWNYADKVYCFLILPASKEIGEQRNDAIDLFHQISNWSDITVLQDNKDLPNNVDYEDGMAQLVKCCLEQPLNKEDHSLMTVAEWTTVKQMWAILNTYVINQMPAYLESATFSFHKRGKEDCWY